jgi:AcrR family transcriptional regulator
VGNYAATIGSARPRSIPSASSASRNDRVKAARITFWRQVSRSARAIGYHYGTIQELLDAALAEAVRRWFEPLIGLLSRSQPPPTFEQLGPALDGLLDTLAGHRPLVIAYFEALLRAERSPPLRTALAADLDAFRQALTVGIQSLLAGQPSLIRRIPRPPAASSWPPSTV